MPFKSKAQARKFYEMLQRGEITQKQFDEWSKGVDLRGLPDRVAKPPKSTKFRPVKIVK